MDSSPIQFMDIERRNASVSPLVCYSPTMISMNGIWQGGNPLDYSLPLFLLQLLLVVLTTRTTAILLHPLRQPRYVAEIIGGLVLGPTVMGRIPNFSMLVFPLRSVLVLETIAHLGLIYFIFTVGIEIEISVVKHTGRRSLAFAVAGTVVPFFLGSFSGLILHRHLNEGVNEGAFLTFLGVALTVTAFSVLARILAELKLLNSDLGRVALSTTILIDSCAWILLALAITLAENDGNMVASFWTVLSGVTFFVSCFVFVKPLVLWVVRHTPDGEEVDELYICIILVGVMVFAFVADAIGIHAIFGAFVFGLVIPNGPLGAALVEKVEDFVAGLLLPLFFTISGLRTNLSAVKNVGSAAFLVIVILAAAVAKVAGCLVVGFFYKMPMRDGLSLGLLMNTKGVIEMVILNIGRDKDVLGEQSFTVMVFMSVLLTALVSPLMTTVLKPTNKRLASYKRRTIQWSKPESELRILACVHTTRNVPTMISLLEASHPTKRSPILVYALHLIELTGRASAMLIIHNTRSSRSSRHHPNHQQPPTTGTSRLQAQSDHIIHAFETYEQHAAGVSIQPLTAISPYPTMHDDICSVAEDKHAALIILPFHKHQTVDGGMEATNPAIRSLNQNVLTYAPCSVAILVDRGLSAIARITASGGGGHHAGHRVVLLFFGGPDDREALSYASRMAEHPGIGLTVLRFVSGVEDDDASSVKVRSTAKDERILTVKTDEDSEWELDEECINLFRLRNAGDESVVFVEKVVYNAEETVAAVRSMDSVHDLYIVGRGQGLGSSPLLKGLTDWSECPELGPIGDLLASSDFAATVSVLVVQQGAGGMPTVEAGAMTPDSPAKMVQLHFNNVDYRTKAVGVQRL